MLLNNLFTILKSGYSRFISESTSWQIPNSIITASDGTSNNGWFYSSSPSASSTGGITNQLQVLIGIGDDAVASKASFYVGVGTGSEDPSGNEYTLTNAKLAKVQRSNFAINSDGALTASCTITNTDESAVTYSEIGLFLYGSFATSSSAHPNKYVMVSRELLDAPITLQAGESATLTCTFAWS